MAPVPAGERGGSPSGEAVAALQFVRVPLSRLSTALLGAVRPSSVIGLEAKVSPEANQVAKPSGKLTGNINVADQVKIVT